MLEKSAGDRQILVVSHIDLQRKIVNLSVGPALCRRQHILQAIRLLHRTGKVHNIGMLQNIHPTMKHAAEMIHIKEIYIIAFAAFLRSLGDSHRLVLALPVIALILYDDYFPGYRNAIQVDGKMGDIRLSALVRRMVDIPRGREGLETYFD